MESMMNKSFKTLEFNKILEKLAQYTDSEAVKKRILDIKPYKTLDEAKAAQRETTEAVITSLKLGEPSVNLSSENVTLYAKRAEQNGVLHPRELIAVSRRSGGRMFNSPRFGKSYAYRQKC